ncbi:clathrin coat assembly protein AP180-like [Juglans microcarpa x Juglans regia]|uniref:clathrin coat assembly protein AP180-like n=1 Tax=Juglans microcarpa x Juglans regia TaxID=2249226 RepID=UPI001B7ECF67|nr:clathrin coat assembly protein AP180-like [Juglans microcarpa x Juglans regia]
MRRGAKIFNLSSFRDDSNSNPWDYTAFVRTFALYLDERLDCFLTGKLQRRFTYNRQRDSIPHRRRLISSSMHDMKPAILLDRISCWQRLLDRAIGTRPTGAARSSRLVLIALYAIVQESFDLYRDISDGLSLLLDSFFRLQYQSSVSAFQACVKATKQFEELSSFYDVCKNIGVGRTSEYPSVKKISDELVETLQDFLKDQASFPKHNGRTPLLLPGPPPNDRTSNAERLSCDQSKTSGQRVSRRGRSERSWSCTTLEDLVSVAEPDVTNPQITELIEQECYSEEQSEKQHTLVGDLIGSDVSGSNFSLPLKQGTNSCFESMCMNDDWPKHEEKKEEDQEQQLGHETSETSGLELARPINGWELVLFESDQTQHEMQPFTNLANGFEPLVVKEDSLFLASLPQHQYNPFLEEAAAIAISAAPTSDEPAFFAANDSFSVAPTFYAAWPTFCMQIETLAAPIFSAQNFDNTTTVAPTFRVQNSDETEEAPAFYTKNPNETTAVIPNEKDPFETCTAAMAYTHVSNGSMNQQSLLHDQQQLWLENQNKIIAKLMT